MNQKIPVSEGALIRRINRKLKKDQEWLRKTRGDPGDSVGDFYILDLNRNIIINTHVDIEELGRKVGALQPYEVLSSK